jgi:hypothetical protein
MDDDDMDGGLLVDMDALDLHQEGPALTFRLMFSANWEEDQNDEPPADGKWIKTDPTTVYWCVHCGLPMMTFFPTDGEVQLDTKTNGLQDTKTNAAQFIPQAGISVNVHPDDEDEPATPANQVWFRFAAYGGGFTPIDDLQQVWFRHDGYYQHPMAIMLVHE